jgi:hypothetical protein
LSKSIAESRRGVKDNLFQGHLTASPDTIAVNPGFLARQREAGYNGAQPPTGDDQEMRYFRNAGFRTGQGGQADGFVS